VGSSGAGGGVGGGAGSSGAGGASGSNQGGTGGAQGQRAGWLYTEGNHIRWEDGSVFRGRGANLQDTRSCWTCAWNPPDADEVMRRADVLLDDWKADFVRLTLESYGANSDERSQGAVQYGTVLEDPDYLSDIQRIVTHMTAKPGVVVHLSLWVDPSIDASGWPTAQTAQEWKRLAHAFKDEPHVIFGLVNEPENNFSGDQDDAVWQAMNSTVTAIREQEDDDGTPHHVVAVQGTGGWSRFLDYYTRFPITAGGGDNVAYEVHVYDPESDFPARFEEPAASIPVIIGEFGPVDEPGVATMTQQDCAALMGRAEALEIPYLGWTFHMNCPPNLLQATASGCGVGADLLPSDWGTLLRTRLSSPYAQQ